MRIALAQQNFHIGNFESNKSKIIDSINKGKKAGCDIVVFSELAICGYPPLDLIEREDFVNKAIDAIKEIASYCDTIAAVVGGPSINSNLQGKKLYNSAYFLAEKKIKSIHNKALLPNYDVFDEFRYFEPAKEFCIAEYKGKKIAITVCEDIWEKQPVENNFEREELYSISPLKELSKQNPDFIINISASPFSYTKKDIRKNIIRNLSKEYALPLFYVNQIGANTELIFDGNSLVANNNGQIISELEKFKQDFKIFDLDEVNANKVEIEKEEYNYIKDIHDALIIGIRDYFYKTGFKTATLGLSGGIDSAVTLALAEKALGAENLRVLMLPSKFSSDHSISDAVGLAENLNIEYQIVNIQEIVDSVDKSLNPIFKDLPFGVAEENIQARIRGTLMMALSNKFGNILLNTSNKSEAAVGYGTLYGDMNGELSVLGDVYKSDVFKLAWFINKDKEIIPENTIVKPPSAELRPDQKDSDSLPDYDILDQILNLYIEKKLSAHKIIAEGFEETTVLRIIKMVNNNEYKRFQTSPVLRVSSKAFGIGRRIPLVAQY